MRRIKLLPLFKTLPMNQRHTSCTRCNYLGCTSYGGHWKWTAVCIWNELKHAVSLKRLYRHMTRLDYSRIEEIEVDGIDYKDAPDFCDAYISAATYKGRAMTYEELEELNDDHDFVYEAVQERIY